MYGQRASVRDQKKIIVNESMKLIEMALYYVYSIEVL